MTDTAQQQQQQQQSAKRKRDEAAATADADPAALTPVASFCIGDAGLGDLLARLAWPSWQTVFKHASAAASLRSVQLLDRTDRARLFAYATQLELLENPPLVLFGKPCHMRRAVGFFARPGVAGYRYSRQTCAAQPLPDWLDRLLDLVNMLVGAAFNGVLVNRYAGAMDYISAHSDDEAGLAPGVGVVALSLGVERTMRFEARAKKARRGAPVERHEIALAPGSLICMHGADFQRTYTHAIRPGKVAGQMPDGVRISLTFRCHRAARTDDE